MVKVLIPLELFMNCILGSNRGRWGQGKPIKAGRRKLKNEYGLDFEAIQKKVLNGDFEVR